MVSKGVTTFCEFMICNSQSWKDEHRNRKVVCLSGVWLVNISTNEIEAPSNRPIRFEDLKIDQSGRSILKTDQSGSMTSKFTVIGSQETEMWIDQHDLRTHKIVLHRGTTRRRSHSLIKDIFERRLQRWRSIPGQKIRNGSERNTPKNHWNMEAYSCRKFPAFFPLLSCRFLRDPVTRIFHLGSFWKNFRKTVLKGCSDTSNTRSYSPHLTQSWKEQATHVLMKQVKCFIDSERELYQYFFSMSFMWGTLLSNIFIDLRFLEKLLKFFSSQM